MNIEIKKEDEIPQAIVLISGGLDSALAAALVKSWGIDVTALHLTSPFGCTNDAVKVAQELNIPLLIKEKGEAFVDMVKNPKYGYGSQMNPCIDCRIYMFELAEKVRLEQRADFIVTGEVVGQRPLSQNKAAMNLIQRKSLIEERVLRPLSGGNLPPTLPEKMGWVKRKDLLKLSGRGRSEQLILAKKLGVTTYASPGGGCLLTEKAFSDRLKDFFSHSTYSTSSQKMAQAALLRLGRHFRLSEKAKVIVARTDSENHQFQALWKDSGALFFQPSNFKGPSAVAFGEFSLESKLRIAALVARYGRKTDNSHFQIQSLESLEENKTETNLLTVEVPLEDLELERWRIGIT